MVMALKTGIIRFTRVFLNAIDKPPILMSLELYSRPTKWVLALRWPTAICHCIIIVMFIGLRFFLLVGCLAISGCNIRLRGCAQYTRSFWSNRMQSTINLLARIQRIVLDKGLVICINWYSWGIKLVVLFIIIPITPSIKIIVVFK